MNIYSNSFFHRVPSCDILIKILEQGFKAFYCKEEIFRGQGIPSTFIGIPMVSFCDIPLAHVAANNYGKCGIAMSRSWGRSRHLEPVLYYPNDKNAQSTKMVIKAADAFVTNRNDYDAYRILGYAKPIQKPTKQIGRNSDNYAEREWRKVYANPAPVKWITETEYNTYRGNPNTAKKSIGLPLHFDVNNIDFILVDKASVKNLQHAIMNTIQHVGGSTDAITEEDKLDMLSKILVYENLIHNL